MTRATIIAAARWIKKNHNPKRLIIAIPITSKGTVELLKNECDADVVVVTSSSSTFRSVSQHYQVFDPISDDIAYDNTYSQHSWADFGVLK